MNLTTLRASSVLAFVLVVAEQGCRVQEGYPRGGGAADSLAVPPGFAIAPYARRVGGARSLAVAPDGSVYVSIPRLGQVVRLWTASDGATADSSQIAVKGLSQPTGIAFHGGWLYIANTNSIVRTRLGPDGLAIGTLDTVAKIEGGGEHWTRSILFGRDGALYLSMGSTCNVCVETNPQRAAVMRFDADGKNGRVFSRGLRNAVGMALEPHTGAIWVSLNERDNIEPDHQNLPPDEINILQEGGDYGWPYCYALHGKRVPNPEFHDPDRCADKIPAAFEIQAHSAPLGMTFLDRAVMLPQEYRTDLLVAYHGSWNRDIPTGDKVVRILVKNGHPLGVEDFVTGWQRPDGSRWGRPSDIVVAGDGSVLIADDRGDAIWRVTYRAR
ncbi:MAG TPA: PQQ-dependent sugar dehydrogenase [Gemmatimonadaceae bacterium]|nr:PQQ-dependent sugar dehydrogenase [Gemmatimonadaceae bacterium]